MNHTPASAKARRGAGRQGGGHRAGAAGLPARLCAMRLVSGVVHDGASIDDLAGPRSNLQEWQCLDSRDAALARTIALITLRHRRGIHAALARNWKRPPPGKAWRLWHALETAAAQILFMDVPAPAAANLAVSAIANHPPSARFSGFANAVLRSLARDVIVMRETALSCSPFPEWMQRRLVRDHGKAKTGEMGRRIRDLPVTDINFRSDGDRERFLGQLPADIGPVHLPGGMVRLAGAGAIAELPGYAEGGWWVQEFAAAQPVSLFGSLQDLEIADLCAAPGGKTMQLAAAGARVTALDQSAQRMERLSENLARTRLPASIVVSDLLEWNPSQRFDGILLDAPCSATGTVRRHPDILWNKSAEQVTALATLQRRMILHAAGLLKPGGILVYANCSLFKEEGEDLVAAMDAPELAPWPVEPGEQVFMPCINGRGCFRSLPCDDPQTRGKAPGMDGFFAVRFRRV